MRHIDAEKYAEAVLFARKAIKEGVAAERAKMLAKKREVRGRVAGGKRGDPTADDAMVKLAPITVLRCMDGGKTFLINRPEEWLSVFDKTFISYLERYGEEAVDLVRRRYVLGWTTVKIAEHKGISRRAFNNHRDKFLAMLLQHALQQGLLKLD